MSAPLPVRVVLIRVSMMAGRGHDAMKPLIFPIVESVLPPYAALTCYDERVERLPDTIDADIIAFSVETFAAKHAYALAKRYKRESNLIVMGGFHPSALPDEALQYADTVITGDAEDTWPSLMRDFSEGHVKRRYDSSNRTALRSIDYNSALFAGKKYNRIGLVQFSRGCKFHCDFCSVRSFYACGVRQKAEETIVEDIRCIREKVLFFIDDNLFYDEASAVRLFRAIKPLKKKWACQISMDVAQNDRLLRLMKESGCVLVLIGFESLKRENLKQMNKQANIGNAGYEHIIRNIYRHGLMIYATFVCGYDHDTPDDIAETMRFALRNGFAAANFNPLIPMPGTDLYARFEKENRLLYDKWWLQEGYRYGDTAFVPARMTPRELMEACKNARFAFNTFGSMLYRLVRGGAYRHPVSLAVFLILNIVSRREIHRKQGRVLG